MIEKIYSITCDNCSQGIEHITWTPTYKNIRDTGAVISKGKHFCDNECKNKYFALDVKHEEVKE